MRGAAARITPPTVLVVMFRMRPDSAARISTRLRRASTATLNATLQPTVGRYLAALESALRDDGFSGEVLIVQSNGGVMSVDTARARPVRTALSGPAAGAGRRKT